MKECFLLHRPKTPGSHGGNMIYLMGTPISMRRTAAIGDSLCATVVADRLMDMGFEVDYQTHPSNHAMLRYHPRLRRLSAPGPVCQVNLDGAYEKDPNRRKKHFHEMFFEKAALQLQTIGMNLGGPPRNCRPRLHVPFNVVDGTRDRLRKYPQPWVMICPRSESYSVRRVPDGVWSEATKRIQGSCFWLGLHPAPPEIVDLGCRNLQSLLYYIAASDLMVSVDTGPMHIAAALGIPTVAISQSSNPILHLNDQNDYVTIGPNLDCLNCQQNICPKNSYIPPCQNVSPDLIALAVNARLNYRKDGVSAVIAIYQPDPHTLNRCLAAVIPQVDEVIVTAEANSRVPPGALTDPKVSYVRTYQRKIGYGRNANHGVRHSNFPYILLLNDDVFLDPNAVAILKSEIVSDSRVAAVGHFLRYPTGQIYHAGKIRTPGLRGWAHVDHRQYHPTIKESLEVENNCGASVLVRRAAFYQIGGFDEEFFLYAEDDDFALRLRKAGWKLRYTPHATGVHLEGQSTSKLGTANEHVAKANALFHRKWGPYLEWNRERIPGNFAYLKP